MLHCKTILGQGKLGTKEMNFDLNHATGAGLIARPIDLHSNARNYCTMATRTGKSQVIFHAHTNHLGAHVLTYDTCGYQSFGDM